MGVCVYRHLESWTPADAAAASTDSRCSPFGLGLNQQRGGGELVYPHWLYRGHRQPTAREGPTAWRMRMGLCLRRAR